MRVSERVCAAGCENGDLCVICVHRHRRGCRRHRESRGSAPTDGAVTREASSPARGRRGGWSGGSGGRRAGPTTPPLRGRQGCSGRRQTRATTAFAGWLGIVASTAPQRERERRGPGCERGIGRGRRPRGRTVMGSGKTSPAPHGRGTSGCRLVGRRHMLRAPDGDGVWGNDAFALWPLSSGLLGDSPCCACRTRGATCSLPLSVTTCAWWCDGDEKQGGGRTRESERGERSIIEWGLWQSA